MAAKSVLKKALLIPYWLYVVLIFIPLTLISSVLTIISGILDSEGILALRCCRFWARSCLALAGLKVRVEGLERLNPQSSNIFMSNHASFLDILLAFAYLPTDFRFIIKESVFSVPFVGWALRRSGHIPITRRFPRKALMSLIRAENLLKEGISIAVYPEGTRSVTGELQEFKPMLFVLPIRSQTPVVPVILEGTYQALKRGSMLLNPVPLKITFCDPVLPVSLEPRDRKTFAGNIRQLLSVKPPNPHC
ncbi:MAG: hypothetical protein GTO40_02025 [Deltaproteobacteria bacterium]|nr:hypothetical protein [Deltaproteobacteria bacterium]